MRDFSFLHFEVFNKYIDSGYWNFSEFQKE